MENEIPQDNAATGDKTIITTNSNIVEMTEQPKPKFTLVDLEQRLTTCYDILLKGITPQDIRNAVNNIQELLAIVSKIKNDLDIIEMPHEVNQAITTELNTEKVEFYVCGVQLFEHGVLKGTSLYSTVIKARKIRDILNSKFAELKVKHEAKILNYPVY